MKTINPVRISNGAFVFCRFTIAILLWLAFLLHLKGMVFVVLAIFILSAILKIKHAPLIVLYSYTINRVFPSKQVMLDENAMRFIHSLGASIAMLCLLFLYLINNPVGWVLLFIFAVLKTISALGYCPASKLYSCVLSKGSCCAFLKGKSC
jgi:hypothetical protein